MSSHVRSSSYKIEWSWPLYHTSFHHVLVVYYNRYTKQNIKKHLLFNLAFQQMKSCHKENVYEYNKELHQSQTSEEPTVPWGRDYEQ